MTSKTQIAAAELVADIDILVKIYPEGIDTRAVQDYLGLNTQTAYLAMCLAAKSAGLCILEKRWPGEVRRLWKKIIRPPLPRLTGREAVILAVMAGLAENQVGWAENRISVFVPMRLVTSGADIIKFGRLRETPQTIWPIIRALANKDAIYIQFSGRGHRASTYRILRDPKLINPQQGVV